MQMETPDTPPAPKSPQMAGCQQEPCSLSSDTPETDAALVDHMPEVSEWSQCYLDLTIHARRMERERNTALAATESVRERLYELPELVLANEKKNPAWSKAELWGIERDIIPSVRALCWSAAALLPENSQAQPPKVG